MSARLAVVPYDPAWPELFARERERLLRAFPGGTATIEHVGSTAVPGLPAKPVIDVMVGVDELSVADAAIPDMEGLGYHYVPEYERELPERRYFRRPAARPRTHHVHCVVKGGEFWLRHIAFRDRLRGDPETAAAYAALKHRLAQLHANDRRAYTDGKTPFIEGVLAEMGVS